MRFQVTAISLACITLLSACGGGGDAVEGAGTLVQSITFPFPGTRTLATTPAPLAATTNSGLPVTFTSNTPAICTVTEGKLVPLMTGECSISANQAGDSTWSAAAEAQQLFKIVQNKQEITFESPGFQAITGTPPPLVATSDSGLAVSFFSGSEDVCTVSGTTLTLVSKGTCSITALQTGNTNYTPAQPVTVSFLIDDAPPPVLTLASGYQSGNMTLEGGGYGLFAGSNLDNWWCYNSEPDWCSGSVSADGSSITNSYLLQPATLSPPYTGGIGGYIGWEIFAPGITGFDTTGNMTAGIQVDKQKTLKLNLGLNAEWFGATGSSKSIRVTLQLGHFAMKDNNPCNVAIRRNFTPDLPGLATYELELSSFEVSETCGLNLLPTDAATELTAHPIVRIKVESADGINTTVPSTSAPTYNNELTVGSITVQ